MFYKEMNLLTRQELSDLPTKRLLAYKRKLRKKRSTHNVYDCECCACDDGRRVEQTVNHINCELNSREHVDGKGLNKKKGL